MMNKIAVQHVTLIFFLNICRIKWYHLFFALFFSLQSNLFDQGDNLEVYFWSLDFWISDAYYCKTAKIPKAI